MSFMSNNTSKAISLEKRATSCFSFSSSANMFEECYTITIQNTPVVSPPPWYQTIKNNIRTFF